MQVTFFVDQYPCYSETFIQNQIDGLVAAGVDVQVVTVLSQADAVASAKVDVKAIYQAKGSKFASLKQRLGSVAKGILRPCVWRSLSQTRFKLLRKGLFLPALAADWRSKYGTIDTDIILAHFGTTGVTAAMLIELGLLKGKLVTVFHGFELSEYKVLQRYQAAYSRLFDTAKLCMPVSELWAQRLKVLGCPEAKIKVHHMGIYAETFSMLEPNRPLHKPLRLLSVARLVEKKGLDDAIHAVAILKQQNIAVQLTIVGDGPLKPMLQQLILTLNLSANVVLTGALPHGKVKQALQDCDVFMLPSKTAINGDMEGIPVSLMEAMARGLVVLSTKHSGISELIEHNVSGYLVDEHAPQQLAQQIAEIETAKDLAQIRLAARQRIETEFNQQQLNNQLLHTLTALHGTNFAD